MICPSCGQELCFYEVHDCWSCPNIRCSKHGVAFDKRGRMK